MLAALRSSRRPIPCRNRPRAPVAVLLKPLIQLLSSIRWPIEAWWLTGPWMWREQWGRRANALEESGLNSRDAETQAFVEVWNLRRQQQSPPVAALAPLSAERN